MDQYDSVRKTLTKEAFTLKETHEVEKFNKLALGKDQEVVEKFAEWKLNNAIRK